MLKIAPCAPCDELLLVKLYCNLPLICLQAKTFSFRYRKQIEKANLLLLKLLLLVHRPKRFHLGKKDAFMPSLALLLFFL